MKYPNLIMAVAAVVAASMDQVFRPGFQPLSEQQQQAKSGVVTVISGGLDPRIEGVADADPLRTTMGGLIVEALRAADDPQTVSAMVNGNTGDAIATRRVTLHDAGMAAAATAADAITGTTLVANLTFDNGSKNNDSVSNAVADGTQTSTQINAKLATRKPTFSLASLINALEDVAIDEEVRYEILFDQDDNGGLGRVKVFQVDTHAHLNSADDAGINAASEQHAVFQVDTTPASSAEKLAGE